MVLGSHGILADSDTYVVDVSDGSVDGTIIASSSGPFAQRYRDPFTVAPNILTYSCNLADGGFYMSADTTHTTWDAGEQAMKVSLALSANTQLRSFAFVGGGKEASDCPDAVYKAKHDLQLIARIKISNAPGDAVVVGFWGLTSTNVQLGPAIHVTNVTTSPWTTIRYAACLYNDDATVSCGSYVGGLSKDTYYTFTLTWTAADQTVSVRTGDLVATVTGTWEIANTADNCVAGSGSCILGTRIGIRDLDGGLAGTTTGFVDDLSKGKYREGYWTSDPIPASRILSIYVVYRIHPAIKEDNEDPATLGTFFANTTTNVYARTTLSTSGSSILLTDATATSGSVGAIVPFWTIAINLYDADGLALVETQVNSVIVTYEVDPPSPRDPGRWIVPPFSLELAQVRCDPGIAHLDCRAYLTANATGVGIAQSLWFVDGEYVGNGTSANSLYADREIQTIRISVFAFPIRELNVSVQLILTNSQNLILWGTTEINNAWILILITIGIVVALIRYLRRYARTRRNEVSP